MKPDTPPSNKSNPTRRLWIVLLVAILVLAGFYGAKLGWTFYRWDVSNWAYHYWTAPNPDPPVPDDEKHLIFVMVDHYEHGGRRDKERGTRENAIWCDKFMFITRFVSNN